MKTTLPIILIHHGNSWYLPYTIWQLRKTNPNAPIYLVGDDKTKHLRRWLNHVNIDRYIHSTQILKSVYQHKSSLGIEFELTCIERWFILHSFMIEHNIKQCIYLDSDVLAYKNLSYEFQKLPSHEMTWCSFSAHSNYITSRDALKKYCDNIIDLYCNQFPTNLRTNSLYFRVINGEIDMNISDMTFWHDYNLRYPNSLLVLSDPNPMGTYDISMEDIKVFEDDGNGFKRIYWKNNKPFGMVKATNELIPFVTLHFQGKGKSILKRHFKYNSPFFLVFKWQNDCMLFYTRIKNKF